MAATDTLQTAVHHLQGEVPPPLIGPAVTIHGTRIIVHGGRVASTGQLSSSLYMLDLTTFIWSMIFPSAPTDTDGTRRQDYGPAGRFFHSISYYDERLFIFGGMIDDDSATNELWCFDLRRSRWLVLRPPLHDSPVRPRWAHCAGVCGSALLFVGGQEFDNNYLADIAVYDIRRDAWARPRPIPSDRRHSRGYGTYRSALISASTNTSHSQLFNAATGSTTVHANSAIYLYSNQSFNEAEFSLDMLAPPSLAFNQVPMSTTNGPPFLRFPSGGMLGDNVIIGGIYLTTAIQKYAVYSYNMRSKIWTDLNYSSTPSSSWNTSFFCVETCKQILLGELESSTSLLQDYNFRITNFADILEIDVASYGVVANAADTGVAFSLSGQKIGLDTLASGLADMEVVCFGAKSGDNSSDSDGGSFTSGTARIGVLSKVLDLRWGDYYKSLVQSSSRYNIRAADERSRVLFIPERYEIVLALVEWLYSGTLDQSWDLDVLSGLLNLARAYSIPLLKRRVALRLHEYFEPLEGPMHLMEKKAIFHAAAAADELGLLKRGRKAGLDSV
ncbi:hypothetical protein V1512DRAFT_267582 [Lipomyces arxii]|uniref:uncharacterized protein n=1 Tax=Lipomyces arxii TaxID=56418 RepID=UPI0034CEC279